jgi:ribosome biogenesis protein ENP2
MAAKGGGGGGVGTLKSTSINGVKLYSVTGKNYVAPWVLAKKKRSLRKDAGTSPIRLPRFFLFPCGCTVAGLLVCLIGAVAVAVCLAVEYQRRLELIHDLRFETATTRIKVTPDGQYVIASGMQVLLVSVCVI